MNRPRRALVLAHEPQGTSALVGERLRQCGYDVHEHVVTPDVDRPNDAAPFPDAADYDLLVPMGSIRSLTNTGEIDSWIFDEIEMVRAARARGTPVPGVCFGGQLLAAALGGEVENAPASEIGWRRVFAVDGTTNPAGPGPWFQWHYDRFTPPPEAEVLAVNDNAVQLFRLGRCLGTQFHPEVTSAHLAGFLTGFDEQHLNEHGTSSAELRESVRRHEERNARQCFALVDWFLDEVATS
ncbi:MAG: gamma-glutamyl-gamma-aminobutyrate hydrolase family protein [Acidimicrobiaceae bacterium]|nr:gamma-glutamyl-gamma-aminobutyrate hydrolase family protein [Acidimicrobiaceae bacterium]